jgi:hypothetical protein
MGDRGRQLAQRRQPRHARQVRLRLVPRRLDSLALGQVEHERDALVPPAVEHGAADQDRHATAVWANVFLLERLADPGGGQHGQRLVVRRAPCVRCEFPLTQAAGHEVCAAVSHHAEKGVIGLQNPAVEVPEGDADITSL